MVLASLRAISYDVVTLHSRINPFAGQVVVMKSEQGVVVRIEEPLPYVLYTHESTDVCLVSCDDRH